ncbi:Uncharacterised protein [Candidatus Burarchaeum australiense]|nr:Uncharacterised protein [Candidatus Burarchaeum australiense]
MAGKESHDASSGKSSDECCGSGMSSVMWLIIVGLVCLLVGYMAANALGASQAKPAGAGATCPTVQPATTADLTQLKAKVSKYLDDLLALQGAQGVTVEVTNATQSKGMYLVGFDLKQNGAVVQSEEAYVSPDGSLFFPATYGLDMNEALPQPQAPAPTEVVKADKPNVEVFVMSFCPYGQQAENGIGPVANLLANETITVVPHFILFGKSFCEGMVSQGYFASLDECQVQSCNVDNATGDWLCSLHGINELREDARQLCVWKNEPLKWWNYVLAVNSKCTTANVETCWHDAAVEVGVNETAVEECFASEGMALVKADAALSSARGISASPTVVVNGATYSGGRSAENFKSAFCAAFNSPPGVCGQTLSNSTAAASGSCG